jgi:glycine betaine/choline ABC-type transport system substrate-binding protein
MWGWRLAAGSWLDWRRPVVAILLALVLGCLVAGCGAAGAKENSEVTIMVTSRGYVEEKLLREIYAHALEVAGFNVVRRDSPRLAPPEELARGQVSGYPDHLDAALIENASIEHEDVPRLAKVAYQEAKKQLKEKGLVPLAPASFGRSSAVAILRKTAEGHHIKALSDLKKLRRKTSVVEGEYFCYCYGVECLSSLERSYGVGFEASTLVKPPRRLYRALRAGEADAAIVVTTEGRLARKKNWLVLLEDDQHRFPASNAFWLTRQDVIDEAGPDYERAILEAQKGLTLKVMRELDAEVELGRQPPAKVAAEYLASEQSKDTGPGKSK